MDAIPTSTSSSTTTSTLPSVESSSPPAGLLAIPVETRLQVYAYLLRLPAYSRYTTSKEAPPDAAILRTCRLINGEATPLLYGSNTFLAHPSLLASFPRLRPHLTPVSCPAALARIRRFHITLRLDCDPPFTAPAAEAAFSGVDELAIHLAQSSFLGAGCANLRLFEGVRAVKAVRITGSTTGFEEYVAWLERVMTSGPGTDPGKFVAEGPSLVDQLAIPFYV